MKDKVVVITGARLESVRPRQKAWREGMRESSRWPATEHVERRRYNASANMHRARHIPCATPFFPALRDMKRVASEIAVAEPRVDVLINNAGALFSHRQITETVWK